METRVTAKNKMRLTALRTPRFWQCALDIYGSALVPTTFGLCAGGLFSVSAGTPWYNAVLLLCGILAGLLFLVFFVGIVLLYRSPETFLCTKTAVAKKEEQP